MATVERKGRATSISSERERVLREVNEQSVKFIHLWFTDIEGHLKSFSITPAELEGALDDGMGFDGSSITGFNAIEESDMVAIPDPTTFQLMPNGDVRVARMICDVVTSCAPCNLKKGNRLLDEVEMRLISSPKPPSPSLFVTLAAPKVPDVWQPYLTAFGTSTSTAAA